MKLIFLLSLAFCFSAQAGITSRQLAIETERLYNKLESRSAVRPTLALRLADLYFDAAVKVDRTSKSTASEIKEVETLRRRAVDLYEKSLSGFAGQFAKPELPQRLRIQFQLARIHFDLGQFKNAENIWKILSLQSQDKKIQREASLRLAEKYEISNDHGDLNEAKKLYDLAVKTCQTKDLCSYIYYRRAWISHRLGQSDEGLQYLMQALESADRSSVNEILNDFLLFVSRSSTWDFSRALQKVEQYAVQYQRPDLPEKLVDSYFTADQRDKYNQGLVYLNKKVPRVDRLIAQLEFQYSEKNLSEVQSLLKRLNEAVLAKTGFTNDGKKDESEKIFYRLIVQWDGERKARAEYTSLFEQSALTYTALFPQSPEFQKVVEGWLLVQTQPQKKSKQVGLWAEQQKQIKNYPSEIKLRKIRIALAAEQKDYPAIIEESQLLVGLVSSNTEKRSFLYQKARAYYDSKKFVEALPMFLDLAKVGGDGKTDEFSVYSQNLALDIYAIAKDYDSIMTQSRSWLENPGLKRRATQESSLNKEFVDMTLVFEKAQFEKAAGQKDQESLKVFSTFCQQGKFLPQSCENSRQLAITLKDQKTLLATLKTQGKEEDLAAELEFGGFFAEAALLAEKNKNQDFESRLHTALLFELAGKMKERDRILLDTVRFIAKEKKSLNAAQEEILYLTLRDADLLSPDIINFPWSPALGRKELVAAELEKLQKGNKQTKELMLATCRDLGVPWTTLQLSRLKDLNDRQKKISFYGRDSERRFQNRVNALKKLPETSECFVKGTTDSAYRAAAHYTIARSYAGLAEEIRQTPIPEGVDGELLAQVKEQIEKMAAPFAAQAAAWKKQGDDYWGRVSEERKKDEIQVAEWTSGRWDFQSPPVQKTPPSTIVYSWGPLVQKLQKQPYEKNILSEVRNHFEKNGQSRLAAYFKGREKNLQSGDVL